MNNAMQVIKFNHRNGQKNNRKNIGIGKNSKIFSVFDKCGTKSGKTIGDAAGSFRGWL